MKVTKHYYRDHIILYVTEETPQTTLQTTITLDSEGQLRRLGQCLLDLDRTESREVTITPKK